MEAELAVSGIGGVGIVSAIFAGGWWLGIDRGKGARALHKVRSM